MVVPVVAMAVMMVTVSMTVSVLAPMAMIVVMIVVVVRMSGVIVRHGLSHPTKGGRDQS